MAIAWVFPGQGSQKLGMAEAVLPLPGAAERFAQASELLGRDLLAICAGTASGELTDLNDSRRGPLAYRYDLVGRLLEATSRVAVETFAFDPASNLQVAAIGVADWTVT